MDLGQAMRASLPGASQSGLDSGRVTTRTSWHRWTAISLLAYAFLAESSAWQRTLDGSAAALGLIPVTVPELLRQLAAPSFPSPAATSPTTTPGRYGAAATSTKPSKPTSAGTLTPTNRHDNDLQLPQLCWAHETIKA